MCVDRGLWVLPYFPPDFARVADAVVAETKNVQLILHATVAEARAENSRINEVCALAWNEPLLLRPNAVVDCTGEATAAALAGASSENGATDQSPALVFVLENVDPGLAERGLLEVRRELRRGRSKRRFARALRTVVADSRHRREWPIRFQIQFAARQSGPRCSGSKSRIGNAKRARCLSHSQRFLTQKVAVVSERASRFRRAATRRPLRSPHSWACAVDRRRSFERAEIAAGYRARLLADGTLDQRPRPEMNYFAERDFYDIPLDCLRPMELENIFVAGRCLSATTGAMTSARVIGTALATGWAAGTAAAFQASGRPLDEAAALVRKQM